jgi:hypothetical protein
MAEYKFLEGPHVEVERELASLERDGWRVVSIAKERPSDSLLEQNRYWSGAAPFLRKERTDHAYVLLEKQQNN